MPLDNFMFSSDAHCSCDEGIGDARRSGRPRRRLLVSSPYVADPSGGLILTPGPPDPLFVPNWKPWPMPVIPPLPPRENTLLDPRIYEKQHNQGVMSNSGVGESQAYFLVPRNEEIDVEGLGDSKGFWRNLGQGVLTGVQIGLQRGVPELDESGYGPQAGYYPDQGGLRANVGVNQGGVQASGTGQIPITWILLGGLALVLILKKK